MLRRLDGEVGAGAGVVALPDRGRVAPGIHHQLQMLPTPSVTGSDVDRPRPARLGRTSITTSYRVLRDAELLVEGTLRHVLVELRGQLGREPGAKTAIPDWMREGLTAYLG